VIFTWFLVAAVLHVIEEYVYPGGFLRWLRIAVGVAPSVAEAIVINALFLGLVATPIFGEVSSVFAQSIPALLLANGVAHVVGTVLTTRYSPGVITSVLVFFPLGTYALLKTPTVSGAGILLGIGWMLVPLTVVVLRRSFTRR
jgi:hypothetical protein